MKKSKFSDSQIMDALKHVETGLPVPELCRLLSMHQTSRQKQSAEARKLLRFA